ncbi:MAG: hypothetical protein IT374_11660 [Polyangiaceae bacterium]|nr:hypothetical protein [Polyangiaceae bacterium]
MTKLAAALALSLVVAGCKPSPSGGAAREIDAGSPSREIRCDACTAAACDADAADACFQLGVACETGEGAPQNLSRARALWDRAARAGHAGARAKIRAHWGGI